MNKNILFTNFLFVLLSLIISCDSSVDNGIGASVDSTYVDSISGDDINGDGSVTNPYKTITFALQSPNLGKDIILSGGIYDVASGEEFPLILKSGQGLGAITLNQNNNNFALIRGSGIYQSAYVKPIQSVAVVMENARGLYSLIIESPTGIAVWDENTGIETQIIENIIQNSNIGIVSVNNSKLKVIRTEIKNNTSSGIQVLHNSSPVFVNSKIINNLVGFVVTDNGNPNFSILNVRGNNIISQNTNCDLSHLGTMDLKTIGTVWDDNIFNFSISDSCSSGANIANLGSGSVDYQDIPSEILLLFSNSRKINLTLPLFGEVLFTNQPSFSWEPGTSNILLLAVFDMPVKTDGNSITNLDNIVWLWHSGIGTGISGAVNFEDGRKIISGDINNLSAPIPLESGRSYYWVVYEWDDSALKITRSSIVSYFRIAK